MKNIMKSHILFISPFSKKSTLKHLNNYYYENDDNQKKGKRRIYEDDDTVDNYKEDLNDNSIDNNERSNKKKYIKTENEEIPNEKDISKTINCPICYDDVKFSYVTNCNHHFCYNCIDKLISKSTNNKMTCPICRKLCKI